MTMFVHSSTSSYYFPILHFFKFNKKMELVALFITYDHFGMYIIYLKSFSMTGVIYIYFGQCLEMLSVGAI